MIIRKIRPEEMKTALEIWSHVFQIPLADAALSKEEFFEKRTTAPKSREDLYWDQRWAAFDDKEEIMMCSMIAAPYTMQFDGHEVPMAGIGGVGTLPPYRKTGCTRACLTAVLQSAYEEGMLFSYLYPFSAAFYRKFGYGPAGERNRWTIRLDMLKNVTGGQSPCHTFRLLDETEASVSAQNTVTNPPLVGASSDVAADLRKVDEAWFRRYNLMTRDEDIEYQGMKSLRPYENTTFTYVYYDAEQQPKAAVTYTKKPGDGPRTLQCSRFVFENAEGCLALLSLLGRENAQYEQAEILLPGDFDLSAILPEWKSGAVSCAREQYGMVRVVNAEQVLKRSKTRGTGALRIRITDKIIEENNACFSVSFENGSVTDVRKTDEPADITLTINAFSTLISGRCDPEMLPYLPEVKLHCEAEQAGKIFYRKPIFTSKMF